MKPVVLDASAAVAFVHPSQSTAASRALASASDEFEFVVPYIFEWEVRNSLLVLSRRPGAQTNFDECVGRLLELNAFVLDPIPAHLIPSLTEIAKQTGLSVFDASYFSLAAAKSFALASRDRRLLQACVGHGVEVLDLR